MNDLKIKEAVLKDAAIIALLGRITFTETFGHLFRDKNDLLSYFNETFSVEKIKKGIQKANNKFWVAYVNDLPVGYAKLKLNSVSEFIIDKKTAQLQKIYVLNDFIAQKVGFQLQNILLNEAKKQGANQIWLSVLKSNNRAFNFYKKSNFTIIGKHDFQIGKENFNFNVLVKKLI